MKLTGFNFLCLLIAGCFATYVRCEATYTLIAPSQVHAGRTLSSLLSVYYDSPSDVEIKVYSSSSPNTPLLTLAKAVTGNGGVTTLAVEIPGNWISGDYKLNVTNDRFNGEATFKVISVPYAILIQTDKPIYKPSQTVNIRVAIIDDNLIPRNETVTVLIEDAEGNKIQQWLNVESEMGLTQFALLLSDRPPLGEWKITVSTDVKDQEKTIKIDEYVLPRFEVTVELPPYILKSVESISTLVSAQYTFGEDVEGEFSIKFESSNGELRKTGIAIKGRAVVTLNLKEIQEIGLINGLFKATADVYEPLSGKTLSGSGSTDIVVSDYSIKFMDINSKSYRPNQTYTAYFDVSKADGMRITGETNTLVVTIDDGSDTDALATKSVVVPDNGIVAVTINMPSKGYRVYLRSKLILANGEEIEGPVENDLLKFDSINEDIFLQISTSILSVPTVGDAGDVTVTTAGKDEMFSYIVVSRGKVVTSGSGTLNSGSATFSLTITQDFTPQAYVVAYAVLGGELLADSFSFNVEGTFVNEVTMEFQDSEGEVIEQAMPGDAVNVQVSTEAGSIVGLLSVDKSVLLLGGGNDITQSQVLTELMSLVKTSSACGDDDDEDDDHGFRFFWFPTFGGKSTEDIISGAGMTVSTDAELQNCYPGPIMFSRGQNGVFAMRGMAGHPGRDSSVPESTPPALETTQVSRKRILFPETWLWGLSLSKNGTLVLPKTVPDTITSWVATAISMHPTSGIAVTAQSTDLIVKLPFFISAILPYSAVKGEELELKIVLNNYGDADDTCSVTIEGSAQYEVKVGENDLYQPEQDLELKPEPVGKGAGAVVIAWLNPKVVDTISLSVKAVCTSGAGDAVVREVLVKPAGYPMETCDSEFVQLDEGDEAKVVEFDTDIAVDYVEDSKTVQVQVTGDVMGPSIEGLEGLVKVPYGCGEQNMITFTPNIFVRRYLDQIGKLDSDIKIRTTTNMQTGYQRELTYKHTDGSFSAFGNSDPSGSTWLTAFVMKCFRQASVFVDIDDGVMNRAVSWLNSQKSKSTPGMFNEPGRVIHTEMQGGSSGGITLTAFVVISFLEDVTGSELVSNIESLALTINYLEDSMSDVEANPYQLSIITYSLQLAESNKADDFVAKLESLQIEDAGLVWWDLPSAETAQNKLGYASYKSGPSSTEMTSYALLTYVARNDVAKAKKIALWLTKKRGSNGGFESTQDTVLGLQALAGYAQLVVSDSTNLEVSFESNLADTFDHSITASNAIITKKNSFKPAEGIRKITATVSGVGSAIVTTCTGYNVKSKTEKPTTIVTTNVITPGKNSNKTTLEACISYVGTGESGMGLIQVMMATGFSANAEDVKAKSGDMARAEATTGGIAVYWNTMVKTNSCVEVPLVKDSVVKGVQDTYVVGSQYYSTESGSRSFYNPTSAAVVVVDDNGSSAATVAATFALNIVMLLLYVVTLR